MSEDLHLHHEISVGQSVASYQQGAKRPDDEAVPPEWEINTANLMFLEKKRRGLCETGDAETFFFFFFVAFLAGDFPADAMREEPC